MSVVSCSKTVTLFTIARWMADDDVSVDQSFIPTLNNRFLEVGENVDKMTFRNLLTSEVSARSVDA